MNKIDRAKKIDWAIRILWESLESHIKGTHTLTTTQKRYVNEVGSSAFHKKCVDEYAAVIKILTELY